MTDMAAETTTVANTTATVIGGAAAAAETAAAAALRGERQGTREPGGKSPLPLLLLLLLLLLLVAPLHVGVGQSGRIAVIALLLHNEVCPDRWNALLLLLLHLLIPPDGYFAFLHRFRTAVPWGRRSRWSQVVVVC